MLSGCKKESYLIVNGSIDKKLGKVEGKYGKFSGEKNFSLKFLKDEVIFSMDSKNESGEINISFVNDSGEELFSFKNPNSVTKTLTISKEKKYTIKITGKDHKGGFKVSWN